MSFCPAALIVPSSKSVRETRGARELKGRQTYPELHWQVQITLFGQHGWPNLEHFTSRIHTCGEERQHRPPWMGISRRVPPTEEDNLASERWPAYFQPIWADSCQMLSVAPIL